MKTIHIIAIITISFIAGMFGGAFSERVFANPTGDEKIPEQIVARGFYLVDENNKPRAGMSFDEAGQPSFYVKDTSGRVRGYMALVPGGPMLALNDNRGNMSIGLSSYEDGKSIVVLMGKNEKPRLALDYKPGKGPALLLFDEENIGKAVMAVRNGMPNVTLLQGDKKPAISMLHDPQKGPMLGVWNTRNEGKAGLGLMNDKPLLFAYNPDDTGLLFNTQRDGRPALGLLSEGSVVWSASGVAPEMPAMDGILDQILR